MDISPPPPPPPLPPPESKPERKTVEKNRRNQMKFLYSKLDSLISSSSSASTSGQPLPDRLDEATNYIKRIEVLELGSGLAAVLIVSSDHDHRAIMYKSIRAVEEGGAEVLNAHYSSFGDKFIVSLHALIIIL
ncbi:Helix-loop-helix DNA-binding domain-containing protein [Carex littledalei]|uniref:Helix-loop-helix DNA-binding domain-containing protein n=1 Tax=Carex littledalei TaxID=544730 RepID=A0A833QV38_9POAL|nr:Helix-loop-helix DNA-binding domain-containing protein [Carex littledalei]